MYPRTNLMTIVLLFSNISYDSPCLPLNVPGFMSWEYTPIERGFDSFYGYFSGSEDYYHHSHDGGLDLWSNRKPVLDVNNTYSTFVYTEQAVGIINAHNASEPLFLYVPFQAVHLPLEVPDNYTERYASLTSVHLTKTLCISGLLNQYRYTYTFT